MPQFFGSRPLTDGGAATDALFASTHGALVAVPEVRRLDEALTWMARGLVEHFGFDRVMVLRPSANRLAISEIAFSEQPELALEARDHAERHPVELGPDSFEAEMVRRQAPTLVVPADDPRAWHPITDQLQTRAYVAAPVSAFGRTVATLHADAHFAGREVDAHDRAAVGVFARVCGGVAERALLFEEIERLKAVPRADAEALVASPPSHPSLTPRENEVLALMARGATSRDIARRLVLSVGTVKTHAHNILRKLGAGTRAEAVARALELSRSPGFPDDGPTSR